ncbi:response regulator [Candidatus Nitrosotalea bavarica]|uniref:response regulator n=1 Tax=Candidatus Nitrosotalea bavarica TaxID=1903277 RepID=UPI000C702B7F|nr:response regulator [Candidatus Nitrosotalea bavarica]
MMDVGRVEKNRCSAIVVDDDEDTVNLFVEFLEICNVTVVGTAFDGKQAEKVYQELVPDVIFSDVMMPNYDGFYALEQIKKVNPLAIVVMITGDVRSETIKKLEDLGADAIIYKPFDMQKVVTTVNELLARKMHNISTNLL